MLLGLLYCDPAHTLSGLLRRVTIVATVSGLSCFLQSAARSVDALPAARQTRFNRQVAPVIVRAHAEQGAQRPWRHGRPRETVVAGFLIADGSTHVKRYAEAMEGQGRHSTTDQARMPGHSLFQSVYCLLGHELPLTLILPQPRQSRIVFTGRGESDMASASWSS